MRTAMLGDMSNLDKIGLAAEDGYVFIVCVCMYVCMCTAMLDDMSNLDMYL